MFSEHKALHFVLTDEGEVESLPAIKLITLEMDNNSVLTLVKLNNSKETKSQHEILPKYHKM